MSENTKSVNKKIFNFKNLFIFFVVLIIIIFITGYFYYNNMIQGIKSKENAEIITIEIKKGSSTNIIAKTLKESNLIKNEFIFKILTKIEKKDGQLKAGKYILNNSMTVYDIIDELEKGGLKEETVKITIPEGYELKQIAKKLSEMGLIKEDEFLKLASKVKNFKQQYEFLSYIDENATLEGFLFPNTYEVYKNSSEEEIIKKMLNEFNRVYLKYIKGNTKINLNELVTLASIIEREAKIDEERPIIAGVFYNRLKIGKKLESCATVQYILGERKSNLTYEDLKINSPYNTYLVEGLPPGPIASPGLESILAALNPDENDYLYFVLKNDGSGGHYFTTNFKDHLRAKNFNK